MIVFRRTDKVAWTMLDGNVMCGTVTGRGVEWGGDTNLYVTRVDGGTCTVLEGMCHWPTDEEWERAIQFFTKRPELEILEVIDEQGCTHPSSSEGDLP